MKSKSFIKFIRDSEYLEIIKKRPTAFLLLSLIAYRAKRTNDNSFDDLEIGEALIGDYEAYGVTEQIYRNDKRWLQRGKYVTFRGTTKGTIAKLVNSSVFDVNFEDEERPLERTSEQEKNEQGTTNKNDKNAYADASAVEMLAELLGKDFKYENGKAYRRTGQGWMKISNIIAYLKSIKESPQPQLHKREEFVNAKDI
jgi:hypothetical protein